MMMMAMPAPEWVTVLGWAVTSLGGVLAAVILADIYIGRYRQPVPAMEAVWPITAIYAGPFALLAYYRWGRPATRKWQRQHGEPPRLGLAATVAVATIPGGAASMIGHAFAMPLVMWTGMTIAGQAVWPMILLIAAFALPLLIAFEYHWLSHADPAQTVGQRLRGATLISTLAILAFDIGMGASMLLVAFVLKYSGTSMALWLIMWAGMWLGFATAYPVVRWWFKKNAVGSPSPAEITDAELVERAR